MIIRALIIFFILHPQVSIAIETRVLGRENNEGLVPVGEYYGENINYHINWSGNHEITVNTDSGTRSILVSSDEIASGFDIWNSQLRNNIQREAVDSQNHNILVRIVNASESPQAPGYTNFNSYSTTPNGQTIININTHWFVNRSWSNYQNLITRGFIAHNTSFDNYIRMMVRLTVVHEVGHALGLMHPEETLLASQIVPRSYLNQLPSIMTSGVSEYFDSLHTIVDRPITLRDILPSNNDIIGANIMLNGTPESLSRTAYFLTSCLYWASKLCVRRTEL
ncbi:hypothetical protein [Vibrio parahaemolyticus]|uniref:hypothetical protein n=1 Tax=Vibrio parahaemolyticus TaxID=670 RepID=UPI000543BB11|nr:hypothetical protein [Vibrio parahaemolyticus]ELU8563676.1 hypothetical protein [Vibrio parahaemolyticus]KHF15987.1 hypothetical protein PO80_08565 [Vibrio parahaemolyticus]MDS1791938.1 hypothetical protein [Vibrio parahaemolyticus]OTV94147.1 hypothetical protein BA739_24415 [Vibrio parahaemolyticus]OTV99002.1 hypothetical protein BA740_24500 [Vibrio parahaemolyticus]